MCVLTGYIGSRQAAPLLLESGERIQGLWSGFYTGIGVLGDDGVIRRCKTTGYSKYFRQRFDLNDLPGKSGFFHSRTNSGGDERYAHPFVSSDRSVMLAGQGRAGYFARFDDRPTAVGNMLLKHGVKFASAITGLDYKKYQILDDRSQVHVSDIVTEYASFLIKELHDPLQTVRKCATDILEEAISLYMFRDHPGHIFVTNVNCRLAVRFRQDGVIAASSKLAFDDTPGRDLELPCCCVADITSDSIKIEPLTDQICVKEITDQTDLTEDILNYIRNNQGVSLAQIRDDVINPRCTDGYLFNAVPHPIMERLLSEKIIRLGSSEVPGPSCCKDMAWRTLIYPA